MKLVTRVALCAALVAGLAACKKDEKKSEPAAKTDGTATATATGTAAPTEPAKKEGVEALSAVKGAIAKADQPMGAMPNLGMSGGSGGGMGGLGAALGGLFGGGGGAARAAEAPSAPAAPGEEAKAAQPVDDGEGDQPPPEDGVPDEFKNIKLPPPGAKGGDCSAVADRIKGLVVAMMEQELGKLPADQRGMVQGQMDEMVAEVHGQMKQMCEDQKWPQTLKDCVLTAPDMGALQKCEQYVTEEMKNQGGPDEPGEPEPPTEPVAAAPAWTGGDDCTAVGQRVMQLAMLQAGEMPPEVKAEVEKSLQEAIAQIAAVCTEGKWSAEVRGCFFKAGTMEAAEACFQTAGM
jgi:hypothetical protein